MNTEFDYNNPIPASEFTILKFEDRKHPSGSKWYFDFIYKGEYYTLTFNYSDYYGFKFIKKYSSELDYKNPTKFGETIYSSTLESDNTPIGQFIEYSLMKANINKKTLTSTKQ